MKMRKVTGTAALLALLAAGVGAAHAGPVSEVATATDKAVFAKAGDVTITLTPRTDLMAGTIANKTVLGSLVIAASSPDDQLVWRWTPGVGTPFEGRPDYWTYSGKNDPTHKLNVTMNDGPDATIAGTDWFKVSKGKFSTVLMTPYNKGTSQDIAPDTYTVSLDAAVWAE
ncbi:hypothetical protein [Yokenella regensburgei]|uniref:hypothetical protein n=1 Tax=Yokenella regensburgei TaxID=158877 RepID=UPI0013754F66|nr:hypothetical protein [Yokenella regensburgei]KAF1366568.1 hypothetical protein FHR25_004969 [Yokenella regensburgei]